ncbi:SRPBCC family protein [Aspergillus saccharolyticus JOP 1030-1]|uniref:DUF3074 domain-containing protein n=1 Tax=Aspergillus saccharolyticus JOP 1030-1 TaxID=1450539 RepID=A0A318Z7Z8_9EURO|nr:hypothetical protein BP01DRAFT_323614 [Aspergillus saccharolyticus JOP 1030-1]PYH43435.1 hypothetical protein BP01DRAFT_323614 [Aspergillus saccharolyticus JOP 1030-1]
MSPPPYIRLQPHPFSILPDHPSLTHSPARPPLHDFLHDILTEAQSFVTAIPTTFKPARRLRPSPPATAFVHLSTCLVSQAASSTDPKKKPSSDFWICRTSIHEDAARDGTASWAEFRAGLRENHSVNEMEYTPSVTAVKTLLQWPSQSVIEGGWQQVEVHVNIIIHTFHPKRLIAPRSFIVLVVSADRPGDQSGFVTVQIPLSPSAEPAETLPDLLHAVRAAQPTNATLATYASVEEVLLTPSEMDADVVTWTMATTSDAGGAIPSWVQRSWSLGGAPKAVVADVGLFIGWIARKRS